MAIASRRLGYHSRLLAITAGSLLAITVGVLAVTVVSLLTITVVGLLAITYASWPFGTVEPLGRLAFWLPSPLGYSYYMYSVPYTRYR